jgi:hypothetical protein
VVAITTNDFRPLLIGQLIGAVWATSVYLKFHRTSG